jgi:8-amino-7-oxononanoate synthase
MSTDRETFSVTGEISTNVSQRVEMARHFSSIGQMPFFQEISSVDAPRRGRRVDQGD